MLRPREILPFLCSGKNFKNSDASWSAGNCLALCPTFQNIYSHVYSYLSIYLITSKCLHWERQMLIQGPRTGIPIACQDAEDKGRSVAVKLLSPAF